MKEFFLQQGGRHIFFSIFDILMSILLLGAFFLMYLPKESLVEGLLFESLVGMVFLSQILGNAHLLIKRKLKRPRLTLKAILIMGLTIFLEMSLLLVFFLILPTPIENSQLAVCLAILSLLDHDINALAVFLLNKVSNFQKRRLYKKARQKRLSFPNLKVIGITGSYGKSSVKEFVSQILSHEFEVLKTSKNTNTEIGIAHTILKSLESKHEVFVCEMGAYKMGEIRICCAMAKPQIALFTGLNEQHIALFGSLDNTFKAKWELVQSLPSEGVAVFNVDSPELKKRLKSTRGKTLTVSTQSADVVAKDIQIKSDHVSFRYKEKLFSCPLVGGFHVVNVLMSIVTAEQLGMSLESIAKAVSKLKSPEKTMELLQFSKGHIIDESYNVNTDGLRAALKHLDTFQKTKKILFFPGILELGDESQEIHESLGEDIAQHVDKAFFFDVNFSKYLQKGALKGGLTRSDIHLSQSYEDQIEELKTLMEKDDEEFVVLFESRGAEKVMQWLKER